jgi:hypothetical protein
VAVEIERQFDEPLGFLPILHWNNFDSQFAQFPSCSFR